MENPYVEEQRWGFGQGCNTLKMELCSESIGDRARSAMELGISRSGVGPECKIM